jgi:hypothetical protein
VYLAISYTLAPSTWVVMSSIDDARLTNKQHVDFFNTCLPADAVCRKSSTCPES